MRITPCQFFVRVPLVPFAVTAFTSSYTLSLHDALPIFTGVSNENHHNSSDGRHAGHGWLFKHLHQREHVKTNQFSDRTVDKGSIDRKSTRLNSSHVEISYAVFCLKKKSGSNEYEDHAMPILCAGATCSFCCYRVHQQLHSFPTRRSSDLYRSIQ